ncbi:MAG: ankyrin repeat domain-containing protein [Polyangiaceae bacterium]|nr:ankyrin repeat domain-containing protein [Polyangiaceae bacterium]
MSAKVHQAVLDHDLDTLARQLAAGEDPNELRDYAPLHNAIGDLEAVALLLRFGADPNIWDGARYVTPLLTAMLCKEPESALMLLAAGADPNVRSSEGDMPLALCAKEGDLKMAAMLLRSGAAKTIDASTGFEWMTALGHAAYRLDIAMIRLLLAWGASISALDADHNYAWERLPERTEENAEKYDLALELLSPKS